MNFLPKSPLVFAQSNKTVHQIQLKMKKMIGFLLVRCDGTHLVFSNSS